MTTQASSNRLGRGLAALIGEVESDAPAPGASGERMVPIAFIQANPNNPRRMFADSDLDDLTASIREKGIVQPLLVRRAGESGRYEIIAGERRWRAAQRAGIHQVPVSVRDVDDREALELAIIENVQRADLNAMEEARGYEQLIAEHGYTQVQLAEVIGKSRPHISNTMRLLKLPAEVRSLVEDGELTAGHARALVGHPDPIAAARQIVKTGASVRDAEAIESKAARPKAQAAGKDADTLALEKSLSDHLGLTVSILPRGESGQVQIRYKTLEQLDEVARRLRNDIV